MAKIKQMIKLSQVAARYISPCKADLKFIDQLEEYRLLQESIVKSNQVSSTGISAAVGKGE